MSRNADMSKLEDKIYQLIFRASTDLPEDVEDGLQTAVNREDAGSNAAMTLQTMRENSILARRQGKPICQDTGNLAFFLDIPDGHPANPLKEAITNAVKRAAGEGILRRNIVDPLTGKNTADNIGPGCPQLYITHKNPQDREIDISLILKGGGCENVGCQYSLPDSRIGAARDLQGVRRCALDAVCRAQGRGCAPGVLGICIGGDRASAYTESKRLFLRSLKSSNPVEELAELEDDILTSANSLGIGPMGLGGNTTLLDVFISRLGRVPASYFVTVSYMCWAYRRHHITVKYS